MGVDLALGELAGVDALVWLAVLAETVVLYWGRNVSSWFGKGSIDEGGRGEGCERWIVEVW